MEIIDLSSDDVERVYTNWKQAGVSEGVLEDFLGYRELGPAITCHAVEDDGTKLALFEKRDARNSIKNMSILLAPDLNITEGSYKVMAAHLVKISQVLQEIFNHFVENAIHERGRIKIYNDNDYIRSVLLNMAEYIDKNYPGQYTLRIYRNWIDIQKSEATNDSAGSI